MASNRKSHFYKHLHKHLIVQMSVFVALVSIVTITYLSAYISHQESKAAAKQLKHQAVVVADNLAAAIGPYVVTRNYTSIEGILTRAAQFESIASMQVVDARGNMLSNVVKNKKGKIIPVFDRIDYTMPSKVELTVNYSDNSMEIFNPVILGDVVGWVRIVYQFDKIDQAKIDIWKNNLTSGFFITLITVFMLILVLRKPVVSIKKYTDFADKLNEHNGELIKVDKRSIELNRLGTALNRASANLFEQHHQLQEALDDMEKVAEIVEQSPDIILSIGVNGEVEYINSTTKNKIKELFLSNDESHVLKLLPDNTNEIVQRCLTENNSLNNIESYFKNYTYLWKFTPLKTHNVVHCHAIDISAKKQAEEKLVYQANYDSLTGLPNRVLALDRLKQSIKIAKRSSNHVGLVLLGVDRFKTVNDTLDHGSGDEIIKEIAERLAGCIRDGDTLARFEGDVFLIILNDLRQMLDSKVVAEKAINVMSEAFSVGDHDFHLSLSIGITGCPDDESNEDKLVRNADIAMNKAKESGGSTYQFYTSEFNEQALVKVQMESELRHALKNNELFLTYQPQIDIINKKIIGAEALIRWVNEKLGFVPPDKFISIAEDTGLIVPIGEWVLRTACIEAKKWQHTFDSSLRVAVNVSARQFIGHDFPATVKKVLEETGLSAKNLELEITESLLVEDAHEVVDAINQLKEIGVTLALDDFGTGYSSLSYLKRFPFDILKIDRAFIKDVMENPEDASLCKAIVAIAASLKLYVIGEGVETQEQLDFLHAIGADIVQGYFYSKPLEALPFVEFVESFQG